MMNWRIVAKPKLRMGYAFGSLNPTLDLLLEATLGGPDRRSDLLARLAEIAPEFEFSSASGNGCHSLPNDEQPSTDVQWLLALCQSLQQSLGLGVFEAGRCLHQDPQRARCLVPVAFGAAQAVADLFHQILAWLQASEAATPSHDERLAQAIQGLAAHALAASNSPRFIKAAMELGMPVERLPGGVIQFGLGSRRRRLDSTFTDKTPNVAAKLARNKVFASSLLNQAGLPVPRQAMVQSAEAAVQFGNRVGFPVVIKPADLDGGKGVFPGLANAEEVRRAFAEARRLSSQVLVEKHVMGRDYRLTVLDNELLWAIERVPASVIGDGMRTIAELVELENANPLRGDSRRSPLKRLHLDEDAVETLRKQGLGAAAVPADGQIVFLRQAANVASGGRPVAAFDKVHVDNARLAVRAAALLGLDLAGIDLLIPDIAKSWLEPGNEAAICEVNGQPSLGQITAPGIYKEILQRLVACDGRVPIVVVLGAAQPDAWLDALGAELVGRGLRVGIADQHGVFVNAERVSTGPVSSFRAGRILALDPRVDAIVIAVNDASWLDAGLPWARYDTLVLAGNSLPKVAPSSQDDTSNGLAVWIRHLLPACDRAVIAFPTAPHGEIRLQPSGNAQLHLLEMEDAGAPRRIVELSLAHEP